MGCEARDSELIVAYRLVTADARAGALYAPMSQFVSGAAVQPPVKFTPVCVARLDGVQAGDLIQVMSQCVLSSRPSGPGEDPYEGFTKAEFFSSCGIFLSYSDWSDDDLVDINAGGNIPLDKQDAGDAWYSISSITSPYPVHTKNCMWNSIYWGTYWVALLAWSTSGAATTGLERLKVIQQECYLHVAQFRDDALVVPTS